MLNIGSCFPAPCPTPSARIQHGLVAGRSALASGHLERAHHPLVHIDETNYVRERLLGPSRGHGALFKPFKTPRYVADHPALLVRLRPAGCAHLFRGRVSDATGGRVGGFRIPTAVYPEEDRDFPSTAAHRRVLRSLPNGAGVVPAGCLTNAVPPGQSSEPVSLRAEVTV
jgi:hypothetical protein